MRSFLMVLAATASVLALDAPAASAQSATSDLSAAIAQSKDRMVFVIDDECHQILGRLRLVSADQVSVSGATERTLPLDKIKTIRAVDGHGNGAAIGFAVGLVPAFVLGGIACIESSSAACIGKMFAFGGLFGLSGVAIGIVIDDSHQAPAQTLYSKGRPSPSLNVSPIVAPHGGGINVAIRF